MHADWAVAVATLIGALIGAAALFLIERYRASRRIVRFVTEPPQDLAGPLKAHGEFFGVKVGNVVTNELILASVRVKNTGNVVVENFAFQIIIPGKRGLAVADISSGTPGLDSQLILEQASEPPSVDPLFTVRLPFFNPGEQIHVRFFFDGAPAALKISCRLPGVAVRTYSLTEANQLFEGRYLIYLFNSKYLALMMVLVLLSIIRLIQYVLVDILHVF